MSLSFTSTRGAIECRWIEYALLRDNAQHHLEGALSEAGLEALHAPAAALGGDPVQLDARALADALREVERVVLPMPIERLAISDRTRAVLFRRWPLPAVGNTRELAEAEHRPAVTQRAHTLDEVFGALVRGLRSISETAGTTIEVRDL